VTGLRFRERLEQILDCECPDDLGKGWALSVSFLSGAS